MRRGASNFFLEVGVVLFSLFIIAFIINGLPSFHSHSNNNELTTNMVSSQNNPPGLGSKEREIISRIELVKQQAVNVEQRPMGGKSVRFKTQLPTNPLAAKEAVEVKPVAPTVSSSSPEAEKQKENITKPKPHKHPQDFHPGLDWAIDDFDEVG